MSRDSSLTLAAIMLVTIGCLLAFGQTSAKQTPNLAALIAAMDTEDDIAFQKASTTLVESVSTKKDLFALIRAGRLGNSRIRIGVMGCLHKFRTHPAPEPPDVPGFLIQCLKHKDVEVRWIAASAACHFAVDSPELVTALVRALDDTKCRKGPDSEPIAGRAVASLEHIGPAARPAYSKLIEIAEKHTDTRLRISAIRALGWLSLRDKERKKVLVKPALRLMREDEDEKIRASALASLAQQHDKTWPYLAEFRRTWKEERAKGAKASKLVLVTILERYDCIVGPLAKNALPEVLAVIQDKLADPEIREVAVRAVWHIAPDSKESLQILRQIEDDDTESPKLRRIATISIQGIIWKK